MSSELHLFIIWEKGRIFEEKIISDLMTNFRVKSILEVTWQKQNFSSNLTRFYGESLPDNSFKEKHCGTGPFLLIIVHDLNPRYNYRRTSKGIMKVNVNTFDSKELYRKWTGGGHKIHATNNTQETDHDLVLLIGLNSSDYFKETKYEYSGIYIPYKEDLIGFNGWKSLEQFFYVLNSTINYVVLRNFEYLPNNYHSKEHGDIDLLVENYSEMQRISNSKEVFNFYYRVHNKVLINSEEVFFDFRFLNDDYYDNNWELDILDNRQFNGIFFTPSKINHFYSLLYHALIHKSTMSEEYYVHLKNILNQNSQLIKIDQFDNDKDCQNKILGEYLEKKKYKITEPKDLSVFFNNKRRNLFIFKYNRFYPRKVIKNILLKIKKKIFHNKIFLKCIKMYINNMKKIKQVYLLIKRNIKIYCEYGIFLRKIKKRIKKTFNFKNIRLYSNNSLNNDFVLLKAKNSLNLKSVLIKIFKDSSKYEKEMDFNNLLINTNFYSDICVYDSIIPYISYYYNFELKSISNIKNVQYLREENRRKLIFDIYELSQIIKRNNLEKSFKILKDDIIRNDSNYNIFLDVGSVSLNNDVNSIALMTSKLNKESNYISFHLLETLKKIESNFKMLYPDLWIDMNS